MANNQYHDHEFDYQSDHERRLEKDDKAPANSVGPPTLGPTARPSTTAFIAAGTSGLAGSYAPEKNPTCVLSNRTVPAPLDRAIKPTSDGAQCGWLMRDLAFARSRAARLGRRAPC